MDLTLSTRSQGDRTVLAVAGEVDVYTGPTLRDRISDLLDSGSHALVVDLGRVDFIDSTGLGVLVGALNRSRELGGTLHLVCAQERVLKLLRITGLDQVFVVLPSVEAVLAEVASGDTDGDTDSAVEDASPGPAESASGDASKAGGPETGESETS